MNKYHRQHECKKEIVLIEGKICKRRVSLQSMQTDYTDEKRVLQVMAGSFVLDVYYTCNHLAINRYTVTAPLFT